MRREGQLDGRKQMQVLLVGDYPPPLGGISVHVQQLHGFLRRHGVEARVLDIGKGGRPAPEVLPVHTAPGLAAAVAQHARAGFLVHLHTNGGNPKSWAVVAGVGLVARAWGARPFVTLHSGLAPAYLEASPWRRAVARAALAAYSQVVAVSPALAQALLRAGVRQEKLGVCPAFLPSALTPGAAPCQLEAAVARRRPLLAYAHHPSPVYGRRLMFEALREAAKAHPDIGLAVYGPGTGEAGFLADAGELGVLGRLECFGELEHARALAVLKAASLFVRPTFADGDSVSVREALALGVPCIASDAAERPAGVHLFRRGRSPLS